MENGNCALGIESKHWPVLESYLPLYAAVTRQTLDALWEVMNGGDDPEGVLAGKSQAWRDAAYLDARRTERLADTWAQMDIKEFLQLPLEGLDDFSLVTYQGMCMERDDEVPDGFPELFSHGVSAAKQVLRNHVGSVLVDYEWLYGDLVGYDNLDSDVMHLATVKRAIAHNIHYQKGRDVERLLRTLMAETIRCEQMPDGVHMLVRMIQTSPLCFDLYERACVAFLNNRQYRAAQVAFKGAGKVVYMTGDYRHEYDDLGMMMPTSEREDSRDAETPTEWEQRFRLAINQFPRQLRPKGPWQLAKELVPDLDRVPLKEIPGMR